MNNKFSVLISLSNNHLWNEIPTKMLRYLFKQSIYLHNLKASISSYRYEIEATLNILYQIKDNSIIISFFEEFNKDSYL